MWSKRFKQCNGCDTTINLYHAKGLCKKCYWRINHKKYRIKIKENPLLKEKFQKKQKNYRKKQKDYMKNWRKNNKDKIKEITKRWKLKNHEYNKNYARVYRVKNRERIREWTRKDYAKKKNKIYHAKERSSKLRFEILLRDNFTCQYCGRNPKEDNIKLEIDHKIPQSKGGLNIKENLITSCKDCNIGKGNILI